MSSIEKMRNIADMLLKEHKYSEAFTLYDELYKQIWGTFSTVRYSSSGYTDYFNFKKDDINHIMKNQCLEPVLSSLCVRTLNLSLTAALDEFASIIHGRLCCINASFHVRKYIPANSVFTEFSILFSLMLQPVHQRKIGPIFSFAGTVLDGNKKVKRILTLYSRNMNEKLLAEYSSSNKMNRLNRLNHLLLDYLMVSGERKSDLFKKVSKNIDPLSFTFHYSDYARTSANSNNSQRNNFRGESYKHTFSIASATDEQKYVYYGQLIGLKGKVTREQIHSKYINMISLYHPDRVQHLGPELKQLAEIKSKEINAAYDWFKSRYHF
jgi:hypothetical protein